MPRREVFLPAWPATLRLLHRCRPAGVRRLGATACSHPRARQAAGGGELEPDRKVLLMECV